MKKLNVVFTPDDIDEMFEIRELISESNDGVRKFYGISNILQMVTKCLKENDSVREDSEIICLVEALDAVCLDAFYAGAEAFLKMEKASPRLDKLYEEKRKYVMVKHRKLIEGDLDYG